MPEPLTAIQNRIADALQKSNRQNETVTLIGASKTVSVDRLRPFAKNGLKNLGENYIQEGIAKQNDLKDLDICWHFIGALQSNKAREAIAHFDWIHSVDRVLLFKALEREAALADKTIKVLLQVNVGDESSKAGCRADELEKLAEFCLKQPHLQLRGLMCLPPFCENVADVRPYFLLLRDLRDGLKSTFGMEELELSMGMSHDFEIAIECGATMIRVGTALFGERKNPPK
ncbi:MAG: YggS family pyridoxal phosphate-dependent enzyme [Abditibacteriaceae bacterium]